MSECFPSITDPMYCTEHCAGESCSTRSFYSCCGLCLRDRAGKEQTLSDVMTGRIVSASFEKGYRDYDCGLEDCECPDHDEESLPEGTYITVRLDHDWPVGAFDVEVRRTP